MMPMESLTQVLRIVWYSMKEQAFKGGPSDLGAKILQKY